MQIWPCKSKNEKCKPTLSWDDIKEREGIYEHEGNQGRYFIVLSRYDGQKWGYAILIPCENRFHACPDGWENMNYGFTRLQDARLCVEVR